MAKRLAETIHAVVQRAPLWLRQDLTSKEGAIRARAEEAMAAMIADALANLPTV